MKDKLIKVLNYILFDHNVHIGLAILFALAFVDTRMITEAYTFTDLSIFSKTVYFLVVSYVGITISAYLYKGISK